MTIPEPKNSVSYLKIRQEVDSIALKCERNPSDITIVAASKGHSWMEILPVYRSGCRDFGENKVQEAVEKIPPDFPDVRWHFMGTLQANKVKKILGRVVLIHSVDTPKLAQLISRQSEQLGIVTSILLQANTSGELSKHGLSPDDWKKVFRDLIDLPFLQIAGLMTMAPLTEDEAQVRSCFARLRLLRDELVQLSENQLSLPHLSMGMSNDYPLAIAEGATLLRIGSAIFT